MLKKLFFVCFLFVSYAHACDLKELVETIGSAKEMSDEAKKMIIADAVREYMELQRKQEEMKLQHEQAIRRIDHTSLAKSFMYSFIGIGALVGLPLLADQVGNWLNKKNN